MTAAAFLSVVIVALTQIVKTVFPEKIRGIVTIIVALVVGVVASLLAEPIGLEAFSIAEGIVAALGAIGITSVAEKVGGTDGKAK